MPSALAEIEQRLTFTRQLDLIHLQHRDLNNLDTPVNDEHQLETGLDQQRSCGPTESPEADSEAGPDSDTGPSQTQGAEAIGRFRASGIDCPKVY
jgi:hypothetical protein